MSGKTYRVDQVETKALTAEVEKRLNINQNELLEREGDRYGALSLTKPRLGQGAFKLAILEAYDRRCAITGESALPALEAAHIKSYSSGGSHTVSNGILLRVDIHRMFDKGYITISNNYEVMISKNIEDVIPNSSQYYALNGKKISMPSDVKMHPSLEAFNWHREHCKG